MSGVSKGPVKIVIINTQYVETDAMSFKSVVQKLTGKESATAQEDAKAYEERGNHNRNGAEPEPEPEAADSGIGRSFLMRDDSFDRLLTQMMLPISNDDSLCL